jgi:hypothetical protein
MNGRLQLADVIVHLEEPTLRAAADRVARTLAEYTGCVLVVIGVPGAGVLVAPRSGCLVLVPPGDVIRVAIAAYESLLGGKAFLARRCAVPAALGSPLTE